MDAWVCSKCRAQIPQKEEPKNCPLCGKANLGKFSKVDIPAPKRDAFSDTYDKVVDELGKYREDCTPETARSVMGCECGSTEVHDHEPKKDHS